MMKIKLQLRLAAVFSVLLVLLAACLPEDGAPSLLPDPIKPVTAEPTSGILFVTLRHVEREIGLHQNWELYLVQPDGTGLTRLTENDRVDTSPSWSPDGRQIVFRSRVDGSVCV